MAAVRKRGKTYQIAVSCGYDATGKPFSNEELESLMPWSEEMKQSIVRRTKPTSSSDE